VGVLKALRLIADKVDLGEVAKKQAGDVVGFYDDHKKSLYVRGVDPTPFAKEVIVHELTHALDDQHFGLDHPGCRRRTESRRLHPVDGIPLCRGTPLFSKRSCTPEGRLVSTPPSASLPPHH